MKENAKKKKNPTGEVGGRQEKVVSWKPENKEGGKFLEKGSINSVKRCREQHKNTLNMLSHIHFL
jgi:hypothetical protein